MTQTPKPRTLRLKLYTPHAMQLKLHQSTKRYRVASWGRQSGKSTWGINELVAKAWTNPGTRYWFISPTFPQARVMYRRLIGTLFKSREIMLKKNQSELRVKLINQSEIRFVSGEVFDNLRGETLHGAIIDEVRDQHPDLWPMVIRPMLSTTRGWCTFISTPNGFDAFYDLANKAQTDSDWEFYSAPSTANPLFTEEELRAARSSMSEAQFAQEILAEFRDLTSGRAYANFSPDNLSDTCPFYVGKDWHPQLSVVLGADFNLSPMSWHLGQTRADQWWWFDEIHLKNSHTQEASLELASRIEMLKAQGYAAEPNLIICGDATSKAGQRAAAGQSDYDILKSVLRSRRISFRDITPESNPSVKDRVNAVNTKCKDASGVNHLWLHRQNVPELKKDLERVVWKPGGNATLDEGPMKELTHASDSIGYPVTELTPVKAIKDVGKVKIIQRVW